MKNDKKKRRQYLKPRKQLKVVQGEIEDLQTIPAGEKTAEQLRKLASLYSYRHKLERRVKTGLWTA